MRGFYDMGPTLDETLRNAVRRLAEAGIPHASTDARILLCKAAGLDRVALLRDGDRPISPGTGPKLDRLLARRIAREPVSRILGRREFWGLDLLVTPNVLDPRPDTETLVEAALVHVTSEQTRPWRILDLGTGSGAILCALLSELPAAFGWGVDRSWGACRVARDNLRRCGFDERALVVQGDWSAGLAAQTFDIVVSNPPYIETDTIAELEVEVSRYDPLTALDGGADGLDAYRAIAVRLPELLRPNGAAFLEVGHRQSGSVSRLLQAAGLELGQSQHDLARVERVVSAKRTCHPTPQ